MNVTGWTRFSTALLLGLALLSAAACADDADIDETGALAGKAFVGQLADTLLLGSGDNAEVVKVVPDMDRVLLVSSKARKVTLCDVEADRLTVLREAFLFANDKTESELTHVAISPGGTWAVCTRTLLETDADGKQSDCGGELVFFTAADSQEFGTILSQVPVGPMPDAVAIADDGLHVASANERDGPEAWGKCTVPGEVPSISIVDVSQGPAQAVETLRFTLVDAATGPREPESILFGPDNDLVVATLQDSHEVLFLRLSHWPENGEFELPAAGGTIVRLPDDDVGAGPWPDGIGRFQGDSGELLFVVAGEWNDTFTILDDKGHLVSTTAIAPGDIPTRLPRVLSEGTPRFSPDSVATFQFSGSPHVAFTLRHSGAVAVYDLADPSHPVFASATGVGRSETGGRDEEGSVIRPEGIAAAPDGRFLVTANEGESSLSLVVPVP